MGEKGLTVSGDGEFTDDDVGFTVYKGHPYCEPCHVRLRMPKCKRCKKSIRDGMRAVEALGAKWCWECFVCAVSIPFVVHIQLLDRCIRAVSVRLRIRRSSRRRASRSVSGASVLSSRTRWIYEQTCLSVSDIHCSLTNTLPMF
jgi:hypothetical protein